MHTKLLITRREAGIMLTALAAAISWPAKAKTKQGNRSLRAEPTKAFLRNDDIPTRNLWTLSSRTLDGFSAKVGEECSVTVYNGIDLPLSLHWHGARTMPNAMDGVGGLTQDPILPGGSFTYKFTPQEPGIWLVRPCVLDKTSELTERCCSSLFTVEERNDNQAKIPSWPGPHGANSKQWLRIEDWLLDSSGQLSPSQATMRGKLGNVLSINRQPIPQTFTPRIPDLVSPTIPIERSIKTYHLVIANACNARSFRIRFDGIQAYVVSVDGQPTEAFEPLRSSLPFSPGNRYEVILDMPNGGPDGALIAELGKDIPLIIFKTAEYDPSWLTAPILPKDSGNPLLPKKIRLQDAFRFAISLNAIVEKPSPGIAAEQQAPTAWNFNDLPSEARKTRPLFSVKSGRPVVLTLKNTTTVPQPIHVHGHCFRVLHPLDDGWDLFWIDTLLVPAQTTMRIAFIAGSPGKWLIASTICEHFDGGLWGWFEVIG